jgi:hypothetical protein
VPCREALEAFVIRPPADWLVVIPHWMLLFAFVVPWLEFLFWRVRRQGKSGMKLAGE